MPNGYDRDWIRLLGAVNGFRSRYGRWPKRVRVFPDTLDNLRSLFSPEAWSGILTNLELVADDAPFVAEDDRGGTYSYGQDGFPAERPSPCASDWLGVEPLPGHE